MSCPCYTYHSIYPKYQEGTYAQAFTIDPNPANYYFAKNQWDQSKCLGTQVICFDTEYGALCPGAIVPPVKHTSSLRAQSLYNENLRDIIASRPASEYWNSSNLQPVPNACITGNCQGRPDLPPIAGPHVRPWSFN